MKNCDICLKNIITQNIYLYQNEYDILLNKFNQDIANIILSYYCNFQDYITFTRERKSRIKPEHLDYDSEDEIYGYYWYETHKLCNICFQTGIYYSLMLQNRLPYSRNDISYCYKFINLNNIEQNKIIKDMKLKHLNYIFPKNYHCSYYRQKYPILLNNKYWKINS